jgi:2'-hydroxyisoflavone reductase
MRRRTFLLSSAIGALAGNFSFPSFAASGLKISTDEFFKNSLEKAKRPLSILFLGGTNFVGPATVEYLRRRGHSVTLFNRGQTNPYLFPSLEKLRGNRYPDRHGGLEALKGERQWDVVIDTWRENPKAVERSLDVLSGRFGKYIYVSSIAVYGNQNYETVSPITEKTPLPEVEQPASIDEDIGYRRSKIIADNAVLHGAGSRGVVLRPHGIYGYYMGNDTDGQTYWPIRLQKGGDILCPGDGLDTVQYIDVLDVARFIGDAAEGPHSGAYNISSKITFKAFLEGLQSLSQVPSTLHWVPQQSLIDAGVRPFSNMPLWVPRNLGPGFYNVSDARAAQAGLQYRPFADTFSEVISGFYARLGKNYVFDEDIFTGEPAQALLNELGFISG